MKLESNDLAILKVLVEDGRASLREIAARTSLSTPTVSLHLSRMQKGGLIKGFVPIIDPLATRQVIGFVSLRVPAKRVESIAKALSKMDEVTGVFVTTGSENLTVRVSADDIDGLQRFIGGRLARRLDGEVVSNNIVTSVVKDVPNARLSPSATLRLRCDYCGQEVSANRPYNIRVGTTYHYFCCRTCRRSFLEKNKARIKAAASTAGQTHLQS